MIDKQHYSCLYCYKDFEPKRRRVQKYCSNTCRSKAYHARKTKVKSNTLPSLSNKNKNISKKPLQSEKMSMAGIGNATAGAMAADALISLFTKEQNKPATKGDLALLIEKLNSRYHLITNMPADALGRYPYFDIVEGVVVYMRIKT